MTNAYQDGRWLLCAEDLEALEELRDELWEWLQACGSPLQYVAVGASLHAIDEILNGQQPAAAVQLSLAPSSFPVEQDDLDEHDMDFSISDEGIMLGKVKYVPTEQGASRDHASEIVAHLTERGGYDTRSIRRWIKDARRARMSGAQLETAINSIEFG